MILRRSIRALFISAALLSVATFCAMLPADTKAQEPGAAMILSTGDNLFYYKWFPIDSPAGIAASFDIFKSHYNVNRIIWRGAQAQWMATENVFRSEPEELADLYVMEMDLETKDQLSIKGADEARKRGLAYWGYMPLFEVGASAEAVSMAGFGPYAFEEKIRAEHPEFRLYDRAGIADGSTIEFGYPQVRKYFVDRYEKMFQPGGQFAVYDGVIFYTYVENFFPRFSDQFIFSDIAAKDFKQRYGVDVYSEPFDMDQYLALRGDYVTQYLRELRQVFNKHGKKLAFYIDAREPEIPMRWPSYPDILVPGRIKMDWRTWVKEGLVDEIALRNASSRKDLQPFLDATEGTSVRLGVLTSRLSPELKALHDRGLSQHIWSPELASDFPPVNHPVTDLASDDRIAVMSVLRQVRDGKLDVPTDKLVALFNHPDLILRRQAVAAVLGRRMTDAIPALEQAAMDPENSFRCVVIDALGTLHGPNTVAAIGQSLEKYPVFGMRLVARTAWSMMVSERTDDLVALYRTTSSPYVKTTIIEMVISKRSVPAIDALPAFRSLAVDAAKNPDERLRATAAFALGYYPDRESAELLLKMMDDPSEVIQNAVAFSLGEIARRVDDRQIRETIFNRLVQQEQRYAGDSRRGDQDWGYRVVAESLLFGFGPRGERHLVDVLNGKEPKLADQAWRVLFHPNDGWNFYPIDREAGEALYAYHPRPNRTGVPHRKYELPPRAELINQSFTGIEPDPTGRVGDVWSAGGRWSGLDTDVRFSEADGKSFAELGVGSSGKGARLVGTVAYDVPDKRLKNRLRGHFPASPVAYGVGDGVVELTLSIRKSDRGDALQVALRPDSSSAEFVGFTIASDGRVQAQSSTGQTVQLSMEPHDKGSWKRYTLRLNFNTGKATVLGENPKSEWEGQITFNVDKVYRAVTLTAAGDPGTATQVGELLLTQSFDPK